MMLTLFAPALVTPSYLPPSAQRPNPNAPPVFAATPPQPVVAVIEIVTVAA